MTTLIVVRHGQSASNLNQIFTGQKNTPLTELGIQQAKNTALFLKDYPINAIYASDLSRAMDTASPTAKMHGLEIIPDQAFREIDAGDWEGNRYEYLYQTYPKEYDLWLHDIGRAQPNGGESVVALASRVYAGVDRLIAAHRGQCIAVFTHATPVRVLGARWYGYSVEDTAKVKFCGNASVSVVDYADDGSFSVRLYGYDEHQGNDATVFPKGLV